MSGHTVGGFVTGVIAGVLVVGLLALKNTTPNSYYRTVLIDYGVAAYDARTGKFSRLDPAQVTCSTRGASQ